MAPPREIYLDTNAILNLFPVPRDTLSDAANREHGLFAAHARRLIKENFAQQRIWLTASGILFQELARHSQTDPRRYRRIINYLHPLVNGRVFRDRPQLIAREFRSGDRLTGPSRFEDSKFVHNLRLTVSRPQYLADVVTVARRDAQKYADEHRRLRATVMPAVNAVERRPGESLHQALMRWWAKGGRDFLHDMVATSIVDLARDMAGVTYPADYPPERLRSLWYSYSYSFARVILDIAENRQIKASDYADPRHYGAGSYVDLLVTDDAPLHDAHRLQPWSDVRVQRLREFIAGLS